MAVFSDPVPPMASTDSLFAASPRLAVVVPEAVAPATAGERVGTTRVLHIVNGEHFAGAERVQMHLARCLPENGFVADFVCLRPGRFVAQFDLEHCHCWTTPMRSRYDLSVAARIAEVAGQSDYRLLHAHTPRSAMIAARVAKRLGLPWVYHVHSPTTRDSSRWLQNRLNTWAERWALRSVAHLITVSNSLRNQMIADGWPADRVTVVHNGVPAVRPPRCSTPVPGQPWTLGMVALMRPRKGLEVALAALHHLRQRNCDVRLRCIGPFETEGYQKEIAAIVDRLELGDAVEMSGFAADVPVALAQLDAMVLPSLYGEGLPMVVLEAMAAGLPVVATRVEGTPEAIQHGRQGLLAEPNSATSLAEQLQRLVSGEYEWSAMSEAAVRRHAEAFSDAAMAAGTADVYQRILARRTGEGSAMLPPRA